jgi:NADH:ubiquinone oxidoreductase subunit 6 (subunit J)
VIPRPLIDAAFVFLSVGALVTGYRVFRTDSMVRAAFYLLASFAAVGGVLVLLGLEFLGLVLILMMAGEMLIMAIVMVMYMMNPAGLNPMWMVHQHRRAVVGGVGSFIILAAAILLTDFPTQPASDDVSEVTDQLGIELLGDSMLVFQTAGVALLATMITVVVLAGQRGRFGSAEDGSSEPGLQPDEGEG